MSVIVWGTYCNPTPHYGLSFYCEGSPACSVFDAFSAVTCTNQTSRLYCTNGQTCSNANFTNDVYITFPPNGRTATLYDTVTRHAYTFNESTPISASTSTKAAPRSLEDTVDDILGARTSTPTAAQQINTQFQNVFGEATNPGHELAVSLAARLHQLSPGAGTAAAQQSDITHAISVAVQSATTNVISYVKQCNVENGMEAGIVSVNDASIAGITSVIPQSTLQTWLLTASISHIIANIALVTEFDIAAKVLGQSSPLICSSTTSSATKSSSTATSKSSTKSTTSVKSASTSTSSTTSTTTTSSTTSTSSTSSYDPGVTLSVSTPSACPSATPTGQVYYQTNDTQNNALGGSFTVYNGSVAQVQDILVAPANASSAVYSFPDDVNYYTFSLTLGDGEGIIYTAGSNAITYISAGCADAETFYDTSNNSTVTKVKRKPYSRDSPTGVTVEISVVDNCGQPVTSGFSLQLDCASVMYPQQSAASGPVVSTPTYEAFIGDGSGTYSATCSLDGLNNLNAAWNACNTEDQQAQAEIDTMCGNVKDDTEQAKDQASKIVNQVDQLKQDPVLSTKYAKLISAADKLGSFIAGASPAFDFWDKVCSDTYGLESPSVKAEFDAEDCGYPAALSMGIEGLDNSGQPFTSALGTFSATPTTVMLSGTTTTNPTGTPVYANYLDTGTPGQAIGQADFCCSGSCIDGTSIGKPGLCQNWTDVCLDVTPAPSCAPTQVFADSTGEWIDAGQGACWLFNACDWQINNWTWTCFDCPSGYQAVSSGSCVQPTQNYPGACVACSDPSDVLTGDADAGFQCAKQCSNGGGSGSR